MPFRATGIAIAFFLLLTNHISAQQKKRSVTLINGKYVAPLQNEKIEIKNEKGITLRTATDITPNTGTTLCEGGSVVLTAPSATKYSWKKDGAVITPAVTSPTFTATTSGSYTVVVDDVESSP